MAGEWQITDETAHKAVMTVAAAALDATKPSTAFIKLFYVIEDSAVFGDPPTWPAPTGSATNPTCFAYWDFLYDGNQLHTFNEPEPSVRYGWLIVDAWTEGNISKARTFNDLIHKSVLNSLVPYKSGSTMDYLIGFEQITKDENEQSGFVGNRLAIRFAGKRA